MLIIKEYKPRNTVRREYTQQELSAAFQRVQNRKNWKNRVNAVITIENDEEMRLITQAVIHFTGSVPSFVEVDGKQRHRVTADGYYEAIGA
jgi:hypothetical protein